MGVRGESVRLLGISLAQRFAILSRELACFAVAITRLMPKTPLHRNKLTLACFLLSSCRPAHRGRLRRRARVGAGCGVLRARLVTALPGGARATPPSRHYERNVRMHPAKPRTPPVRATSKGLAQAGSGPINRRGGAPRGERPPARGLRKLIRAGTRAACVRGPPTNGCRMHPSACRRSASLVRVRDIGKPRRTICLARTMTFADLLSAF